MFLIAVAEGGTGPWRASHYKAKFNDSGTISYADQKNDINTVIIYVSLLIILCLSIYLV